jgi:cytochrome c-type biogenesis protein CcmH/NrfG
LCETGQPAAAAVVLRQTIRLKPDHAEAMNNLGLALTDQGQFDEAVGAFEQALRINPR